MSLHVEPNAGLRESDVNRRAIKYDDADALKQPKSLEKKTENTKCCEPRT